MIVFHTVDAWLRARPDRGDRGRPGEGGAAHRPAASLGFVPTMGALHEGHVSLVRRSRADNPRTLVSIFVNPTQFDDPDDLTAYPATLEHDLQLLEDEGVDFVLLPTTAQLYPDGYRYRVVEREQSETLEGAFRPGHFEGVLTVVMKLLQIARADRAYFGEKDWQQYRLIEGMAAAFFLPTAIIGCPTVRDTSGLALSSRNARLAPADAATAPRFHSVLASAASATEARDALRDAGFTVDYVEDSDGRRLAAVRVGGVRLIDNVPLEPRP